MVKVSEIWCKSVVYEIGLAGLFGLKTLRLKNRSDLLKFTLFYDFEPKCLITPISYNTETTWNWVDYLKKHDHLFLFLYLSVS